MLLINKMTRFSIHKFSIPEKSSSRSQRKCYKNWSSYRRSSQWRRLVKNIGGKPEIGGNVVKTENCMGVPDFSWAVGVRQGGPKRRVSCAQALD